MQFKITFHTKYQENLSSDEKRQSTAANIEMTEMLELSDKESSYHKNVPGSN